MAGRNTHFGQAAPVWAIVTLLLYILGSLVLSVVFVARAWPGNPFNGPLYAAEEHRVAALQVTVESVARIEESLALLSRLPDSRETPSFSRADKEKLVTGLAFAAAIRKPDADSAAKTSAPLKNEKSASNSQPATGVTTSKNTLSGPSYEPSRTEKSADSSNAPQNNSSSDKLAVSSPPNLPPDPRLWSSADLTAAQLELRRAHAALEARRILLHDSACSTTCFGRLWEFLCPSEPAKVFLTNSEAARLAKLLGAENASTIQLSPSRSAPVTAQTTTAAPLPNLIDGLRQLDFIILLGALGAAGASTQCLGSLARYLGVGRLNTRAWWLYYITRPWIGAVLGPVFYLILRGGLMSQQADWQDVNQVGYAAVAVIVGFCASEAMENLRKIGSALFREKKSSGDADGSDPHIQSVSVTPTPPTQDAARDAKDSQHLILHVHGMAFAKNASVLVGGQSYQFKPEDWDPSNLVVVLPGNLKLNGLKVQVINPGRVPAVSNEIEIRSTSK